MAKPIVGYRAPQTLFAGMPTGPGVTTSNVVASMPIEGMDVQDQATAYALQQRMKKDREDEWARAAAINRMRQATSKVYDGGGGHYLPPTISQSNPRQYAATQPGASGIPGYSGPVLWAPEGLRGGQLGSWSEKRQKIAMEQNRQPPLILQNYQR